VPELAAPHRAPDLLLERHRGDGVDVDNTTQHQHGLPARVDGCHLIAESLVAQQGGQCLELGRRTRVDRPLVGLARQPGDQANAGGQDVGFELTDRRRLAPPMLVG
jgi:hypothetical protein